MNLQGSWLSLHLCFSSIAVRPGINCNFGGFPRFHKTKQLFLLLQGSWEKNWFTCSQSSPFLHSVTVPLFPLQTVRLQNVILHKQRRKESFCKTCLASGAEVLGNVRAEILNKCSQQFSDPLKLFTY